MFPRIATPASAPTTATEPGLRRSAARNAASVIAATRKVSSTSRLTCTSCHSRYGWSATTSPATSPARGVARRLPIATVSSAVPTATAVCATPTTNQSRPNAQ